MEKFKDLSREELLQVLEQYDDYIMSFDEDFQGLDRTPVCISEFYDNDFNGDLVESEDDYTLNWKDMIYDYINNTEDKYLANISDEEADIIVNDIVDDIMTDMSIWDAINEAMSEYVGHHEIASSKYDEDFFE